MSKAAPGERQCRLIVAYNLAMPRTALALALLAAGVALQLSAQEPALSSDRPAIADLPARFETLSFSGGLHVTDEQGDLVTFWLLETPPKQEPTGEFGVDFGALPPGGLVGVVEFHRDWSDYRKRIVAAGVYSMRYGIQPADGDHTGQTYFRDFLMLLPIAQDAFPIEGQLEAEPLVQVSKQATGTEHPGVIALYQIYDPVDGANVVRNDFDEPCLAVPFDGLIMGLVLFGHGQELPV